MSSIRPVINNKILASIQTLLDNTSNQKLFNCFVAEQAHSHYRNSSVAEKYQRAVIAILQHVTSQPVSTLNKGLL